MKETLTRTATRLRSSFAVFTPGQKVIAILGTMALLLGGFMVFRWASAPSYSPLFSNLSSEDASAVIEQLDSQGVPYEITNGGGTVMVPREVVYKTRIDLSGEGLPSSSDGGYSILDDQGLSTSQFKEQTDFKRAMEGELSSTIEGIDDVQTAVVHLALPEKEVFAEERNPATASVLLQTKPGSTLGDEQVQAVVHLVASSIDGMDPKQVTVADSTGKVLTAPGGGAAGGAGRGQQQALQAELQTRLQTMLDQVVGVGNSTVQVTADLDFDKTVRQTTSYTVAEGVPPISESRSRESYNGAGGPGAPGAVGGVVGPDGQMEIPAGAGTGGEAEYENESETVDNAVNSEVETRETAPGGINSLHVGVVLDSESTLDIDPAEIQQLVGATVGVDRGRGDTVQVSQVPFDRGAEAAAAEELAAAAAAEAAAARMDMFRKIGLGVAVLLGLILAWFRNRRRAKAREQATSYVVEQLKAEQVRTAELAAPPAALALDEAQAKEDQDMQDELTALIERQPEDVAALLRGWLVERPS